MKKSWIFAEVTKGKYKDKYIEIDIGDSPINTVVKINGKRVDNIISAHIHIRGKEKTIKCNLELVKRD